MAHKVVTTEDAVQLIQSKPQTIESLASAIVRGKGYSMTDSKVEFFKAYAETVENLETKLFSVLMMVVEPKRFDKLLKAKAEAEAEAKAETEAETEANSESK